MASLNPNLNSSEKWKDLINENKRRVEVDIDEVERVIDLARRTPGLSAYEDSLRKLAIWSATLIKNLKAKPEYLDVLVSLVQLWEKYRETVIQRFTSITPIELRAADRVVANIFDRFIRQVPTDKISYAPTVRPLVFGGEGGLSAYFTFPPSANLPFAIINLPHSAFDQVWQWLALPHETGHDLYASVEGLGKEMEDALGSAMHIAIQNGDIQIPDVNVDLTPYGIPHTIRYSAADFLATVWRSWANESQADVIGYLNCGGAALATLQQIIGFRAFHPWLLTVDEDGKVIDEPEEHPVSYLRNILGIAALRLMDNGTHNSLADELQARFDSLKPHGSDIIFVIPEADIELFRMPESEMVKSAQLAAKVLMQQQFAALGGKSYEELVNFTAQDQRIVDALVSPIYNGWPNFVETVSGTEPRHALAATVFAFEKVFGLKDAEYREERANTINKTFMHFV